MADITNSKLSEVSDEELLSQSDPVDTIKLANLSNDDDEDDDDTNDVVDDDVDDELDDELDGNMSDKNSIEIDDEEIDPEEESQHVDFTLNTQSNLGENLLNDDSSDDDLNDDLDDEYLKKLKNSMSTNYIDIYHPEQNAHSYEEILSYCTVVKNQKGIIIDPLHRTIPFLTKYEKTRVIGYRAQQLNNGAKAYVDIIGDVIDGYQIAFKELEQKKIPFILRRPIPGGGSEYWRLSDLEVIA
jgi:DNA-directed RNA polymerase I, II, and III subunit RPABC2